MASGYRDTKGTHIRASTSGVCIYCEHNTVEHYFLNDAEYAHCNVGFIFKCGCNGLRKKNWLPEKIVMPDRVSESN